jgi:ABC-2 type transport system ATP-binding protein
MRQRLGLAGALLGDPRVLILDEPANGLDPQGIRWLREFLREFAANGNAVLVSSHLLSEMAQMADEVIVIDRGRLVRQGSLADLTAGHASVRVAAADDGVLQAALIAAGLQPRVDGEAFVVTGAEAGDVGRIAAAEGIALTQLTAQESTLEDAFLELTEGAQR